MMISTIKPHMAASQNTISRWVKLISSKAGIDHSFTTHNSRAAASSMANLKSVPLQTIMRLAGGRMRKHLQNFMRNHYNWKGIQFNLQFGMLQNN